MSELKKYFVIIMMMLPSAWVFSQQQETQATDKSRKVIFDEVKINGKKVDFKNPDNLVLSSSDSITFAYHCEVGENEKTPFLFRLMLKSETDSSVRSVGSPLTMYRDMPEGEYEFIISAFDLERQWRTAEKSLAYRVNNREHKLVNDLKTLKRQVADKDSLVAKLQKEETEAPGGIGITSYIIPFLAGLILTAAVFLYILSNKNKKLKEFGKSIETEREGDPDDISKFKIDALENENSELRGELASLRGQIDALNSRSEELGVRNKELEENVLKLSKSKEELEDLQNQKDELFAIIIHDIKNPASLIKSLVELLRSYDLTATEQQEVINDIIETTSKIVSLSQEVSRVLALEGGRLELNMESTDLRMLLSDLFLKNKVAADKKSISMLLEIPEELPEAYVDSQKYSEVIDNLISNALKFTHSGGTVRLKASATETNIVVEINDNGLGLSEDDIKNAFRRGARLSAQPTAGEASSGLGLWIVKKLVEAHNGRVWVRSQVGKGSTFAVSVPQESNGKSEAIVDMSKE